MWAEDQWLSRNPPGLWHRQGLLRHQSVKLSKYQTLAFSGIMQLLYYFRVLIKLIYYILINVHTLVSLQIAEIF